MQTKNKQNFFLMKMKKKTCNFFSDASDAVSDAASDAEEKFK